MDGLRDFWNEELQTGREYQRVKSAAENFHEFAYPMGYVMENTTYCNGKCAFCTHEKVIQKGDRPSVMLSIGDAKYRIRKLKLYQLLLQPDNEGLFDITGLGESFLNKDIFQILEYVKHFWTEILVTTNGSLLDEQTIRRFMELDLPHLDMSLCYYNRKNYENQLGLSYNTTIANMKNVFIIRNEMNVMTQLKVHIFDNELNSDIDRAEFKALFGEFARESDRVYTRNYDENIGAELHTTNRKRELGRCFPIYEQLVVDVQGNVLPCCSANSHGLSMELCCGKITEEPEVILNRINEIRENQRNGIFADICKRCSLAHEYHVQDVYNVCDERILDFCKKHGKLYIFGAGDIGGRISRMLHFQGIDFEGFIISKISSERTKYGKEIHSIDAVAFDNTVGVIVAVSEEKQREIVDGLIRKGLKADSIFIQDYFK